MKKYHSQFTKAELRCLLSRIRRIREGNMPTKHALKRMEERGITINEVKSVFHRYQVVEVKYDAKNKMSSDLNVLIKSIDPMKDGKDVYLAINLVNGNIVSTYKDTHREFGFVQPDISNYNENMNIMSFLRFYRPKLNKVTNN